MARDETIAAELEPQIPGLRRYAYALTRSGEAADDLVQDTLERAITRWHLRRRDASLKAWLFTIAHNLHIGEIRRWRRRGSHVDLDDLEVAAAADTMPDHGVNQRDIWSGLDSLSDEQRAVLLLVAVEDLSYDDVARVLGVPIGTVMSRLSRARERIRSFLGVSKGAILRRIK